MLPKDATSQVDDRKPVVEATNKREGNEKDSLKCEMIKNLANEEH